MTNLWRLYPTILTVLKIIKDLKDLKDLMRKTLLENTKTKN